MVQMGGTVRELAETELCYTSQFDAAKDPSTSPG
jgi:hypothetical protein